MTVVVAVVGAADVVVPVISTVVPAENKYENHQPKLKLVVHALKL